MESILNDVKRIVHIPEEVNDFDQDLILFINAAFSTLNQLGVGPDNGFAINSEDAKWSDFFVDDRLNDIKTYVGLRVRMLFDPPTIGILSQTFSEQIKELEWRINIKREAVT